MKPILDSVQNESMPHSVRNRESTSEVAINRAIQESKPSLDQAAATSRPNPYFTYAVTSGFIRRSQIEAEVSRRNASFASRVPVPAQERNESIISVLEETPSQQPGRAAPATVAPQSQEDYNNGNTDEGCCANCVNCMVHCLVYYEKVWDAIHSKYALPIWLLLLALPISSGYMGALYINSCRACHSLPMLKYLIGISLMANLSFRICKIIRLLTITDGETWGIRLHLFLLASTFFTIVFFATDVMLFWEMVPSARRSSPAYCDPNFVTYSFWWNCAVSGVMVLIFFFPA